jgi:hypothetical protein
VTCDYDVPVSGQIEGQNIATVRARNFENTANIDFSSPPKTVSFADADVDTIDACVSVSDDRYSGAGDPWIICEDDEDKVINYSLTFGPYTTEQCGEVRETNIATFVTDDTGATDDDDHTVVVTVACATGCTLTPGYWKTHSALGPAPYDAAWLKVGPLGANELFDNGLTYYEVLWTPPQGNVYYILAHAYIAAKLNILDGASTTAAVDQAMATAQTFFTNHSPTSALSLTRAQRNALIAVSGVLDGYNNGLTGPGHCSE